MKKGKEWLKNEMLNLRNASNRVMVVAIGEVMELIDQLGEPEVLSQEWIDNNVVHIRGLGDIFEAETVENLLVPKQELPVITENKFIVRVSTNQYFDGDIVFFGSGQIMSGNTTIHKDDCFVFTNALQAEAVATLVNGEVEVAE